MQFRIVLHLPCCFIFQVNSGLSSFPGHLNLLHLSFLSWEIYLFPLIFICDTINSKKCFYVGTKSKTFTHFFCWHLMNTSPLLFKCGNVWKANDSPFKKKCFLLFSSWCVLITYIHKIPIIVRVYQFPVFSFLFWKLQIIFSF